MVSGGSLCASLAKKCPSLFMSCLPVHRSPHATTLKMTFGSFHVWIAKSKRKFYEDYSDRHFQFALLVIATFRLQKAV